VNSNIFINGEIYYEDDIVIFGDIVLSQELYEILDKPTPSVRRGFFFKNSYYGKKYKMLIRRDLNYLVNAETEYSQTIFKPVLDSVASKGKVDKVLLLGLGTGESIYKIKETKPDCNITVIEVRSELAKYKNKIYNGKFEWINIAVKDYDQVKDRLDKYDIIIDDIGSDLSYKIPFIENNLAENGIYYLMCGYKEIFWNFMALNKNFTIHKIDDMIPDIVLDDIHKKLFQLRS
jgi:hypothetical protein